MAGDRGNRNQVVGILVGLVAFVTLLDGLGRLFVDPSFHVSDIALGTLMGGLLAALGIDITRRIK